MVCDAREYDAKPRKERAQWVKPVFATLSAGSAELAVGTRDDNVDKTS